MEEITSQIEPPIPGMIYDFEEVDIIIQDILEFYKKQGREFGKFPSNMIKSFQLNHNISNGCFGYLLLKLKEHNLELKALQEINLNKNTAINYFIVKFSDDVIEGFLL